MRRNQQASHLFGKHSAMVGTFLRIDVPVVGFADQHVLYTDVDVYFRADVKVEDFANKKALKRRWCIIIIASTHCGMAAACKGRSDTRFLVGIMQLLRGRARVQRLGCEAAGRALRGQRGRHAAERAGASADVRRLPELHLLEGEPAPGLHVPRAGPRRPGRLQHLLPGQHVLKPAISDGGQWDTQGLTLHVCMPFLDAVRASSR